MIQLRAINLLLVVFLSVVSADIYGQDDPEQLEEAAVRAAVKKVEPSVIRFETIGGNNRVDGVIVANGPSTGLVVSKDGYVISSSFNFANQPANILARLPDGKKAAAEIVGRDTSRKIVLLKIQSEYKFTVPKMSASNGLQVGQTVIAIGRVFDGNSPNVSTGIVSAKNRVWNKAVQTDAKISPANFGGPLTDLLGNVVGILVPMSPDDDGEMAGTQWYDSGIGFAVPITDLMGRVEELKSGKTLRPGLLGVSLEGTDLYVDKAIVAFCNGNSPAGKAGIRTGDEIVEIDGQKISRQSELKHAIGPLYEGDQTKLVVSRDGKRIPFTLRLAGETEPYVPAGIGVTLLASDSIVVDRVLENSPAADGDLRPGDLIEAFGKDPIQRPSELRSKLAAAEVGDEIELTISRDGGSKRLKLKLARQSAAPFTQIVEAKKRDAKTIQIKVADAANKCFAMIPELLDSESPPALLVWISAPGKLKRKDLEKTWLDHCKQHNVAILFPESSDEKRWSPDEVDFIASAITNLAKQSQFDSKRVTVGGVESGGTMASLIAFGRRDLFQGLALIDSKASTRITRVETSPVEPLLVLARGDQDDEATKDTVKRFEEANFPVHLEPNKGGLDDWIEAVLSWAGTTNRL